MYTRPVSRIAILIGSQSPKGQFLHGVEGDLAYMNQYLQSPNGGAFRKEEIKILYNISAKQVVTVVQSIISDYVYIYFSGHGYTTIDGRRMLALLDNDAEDLLLLNHSPRQLIVIDACRTRQRPGATIGGINWYREKWLCATGYSMARALYDQWIMDSPHGCKIVHATGDGTPAFENARRSGGQFTLSLLDTVFDKQQKEIYRPLFIADVISEASVLLKNRDVEQRPEIVYSEGFFNVPFGITSSQFIPNEPRVVQYVPQKQISGAEGIALVAGILLTAYCVSKL